jgi:hypothetical protein
MVTWREELMASVASHLTAYATQATAKLREEKDARIKELEWKAHAWDRMDECITSINPETPKKDQVAEALIDKAGEVVTLKARADAAERERDSLRAKLTAIQAAMRQEGEKK